MEERVPRIAFVLTDGRSNSFGATIAAAEELHNNTKIEVYAVAIGSNVNYEELFAIATTTEHVLNTTLDVDQLRELQEFLDREACEGMNYIPNSLFIS